MGWGSSARRSGGRKVHALPRKNLGCAGNLAGMSRTPGSVQKVCADRNRGGHVVKNRQKVSKNIFDTFLHFSRRAKNVKNRQKCQKYFRHFSTFFVRHPFSGPFWGALKKVCAEKVLAHCSFPEGAGGRGLANKHLPEIVLQKRVPLLNLWHGKDLLAPNPSVRQPLFGLSESVTLVCSLLSCGSPSLLSVGSSGRALETLFKPTICNDCC